MPVIFQFFANFVIDTKPHCLILLASCVWVRETESGGPLRMVEKGPKEISKFGKKIKGVKMSRYLVLSPKKCQHI